MAALPQPPCAGFREPPRLPLGPEFMSVLLPSNSQVQELIINKDPTLLDNFLDVSEQPGTG